MSHLDNMPHFRKSLLSRLAMFASEKAQAAIFGKQVRGYDDMADVLEAWDYGPQDERMNEESFSAEESFVLGTFHGAVGAFLEQHGDFRDNRRENDFIYNCRAPVPLQWRHLMALAAETLMIFKDFDVTRWEDEGFPGWGF